MSITTLARTQVSNPDAYYAGRADAYDDATTLTILEMAVRASLYADHHPDIDYVMGYTDRFLEQRRENLAVAAAETELAHVDLSADAVLNRRLANTLAQPLPKQPGAK